MKILQDLNVDELKDLLVGLGEQPFRAKQIFSALHRGERISEISNVKIALRNRLLEEYADMPCEIIKELTSKDKTKKFLFKLYDGNVIEGVLMSYKYGYTLCVSTQVGCRMGCRFCASTLDGLVRNLTSGEILSQILVVNKYIGGSLTKRAVTNVVLMGSGEPLDNYDNVIKFLKLASCKEGINISLRNVSVSTCGLVDKMYSLADENLPINLTVSLHSPFDDMRKQIMPIANKYKVVEIISACKNYFEKTKRRVYFEYSLIKNLNDNERCAVKLSELLRGFSCHINLIRLNSVKERNLIGTSDKSAENFMKTLSEKGLSVTIRRQMGNDIDGACGQLRRNFIQEGKEH